MNKQILSMVVLTILLAGSVMAASLERVAPTSVQAGQSFDVTYKTAGVPAGKYFVAFEETITGCSPTSQKGILMSETGGVESLIKTYVAPSSGSCIFNGVYQYADSSVANLPQVIVTVGSTGCPTGQTKCSDGSCKASCVQPPGDDNTKWYIIGGIAGLVLLVLLLKK